MANNTRVYYATQKVSLQGSNPENKQHSSYYIMKGIQSVGVSTNFALEQVFQFGQLEIYDNVENVPDVEVTIQKIADGTLFCYPVAVGGNTGPANANNKDVGAVSTNRCNVKLEVFSDEEVAAIQQGSAYATVTCSGMYLSSVAYTIPVEGFITEDVTLVGNNKIYSKVTRPTSTSSPQTSQAPQQIGRRIQLSTDSVLPTGSNKKGLIPAPARLQNINVSMDLGREAVYELGKFAPYARYATFPVEVTSEFEVLAENADGVNASDFSASQACASNISNLDDITIKVVICGSGTNDNYTIDLGSKNKLSSVNFSGGDTGGGNATITYSYQTFNKFKVSSSGTFANATNRTV